MDSKTIFDTLGLNDAEMREDYFDGGSLAVKTPVDGSELARVRETSPDQVDAMVARAVDVQKAWRRL
ncbi:MAG: aldehyde dehydrogenase family protein, partial [Proteobacteria bacterium]|nr:aldehyde dehydrogenase family protein [Pseudomonadota bacterium]